jgi:hypothetical protein
MIKSYSLDLARDHAQRYREMLPTFEQVNDKRYGFTVEDMDVLLAATQTTDLVPIEDIRNNMTVQLRVYYRRYVDKITGRAKYEPDRTDALVAALTRGWDSWQITQPKVGYRGVSPLQDFVEDLLGKDGVRPLEPPA